MTQWIEAPDGSGEWLQFEDDATDDFIMKQMQQAYPDSQGPTPTIPRVPTGEEVPPEALPPVPGTAPEKGWRRADLLPIESEYDAINGRMKDTGNWRFALPGFLAGIPEAIDTTKNMDVTAPGGVTDEQLEAVLGLSALGANPIKGSVPNVPLLPKMAAKTIPPVPHAVQSVINKIDERVATEHLPRAQIVRQEVKKFKDEFDPILSAQQKDALHKIVSEQGGPVRRGVEKLATRKPISTGLDFRTMSNIAFPSAGAAMGGHISPGTASAIAVGAQAARVGASVLDKAAVGGAKLATKRMANKDVDKLRTMFAEKPIPNQSEAVIKPQGRALPKDPTEPVPQTPIPENRPMSVMEQYMAEEANKAPPNPSGKIKMTIGEPTKKTQGSLAKKKAKETQQQKNLGIAQPAPAKPKGVLSASSNPSPNRTRMPQTKAQKRQMLEEAVARRNKTKVPQQSGILNPEKVRLKSAVDEAAATGETLSEVLTRRRIEADAAAEAARQKNR